MKTIKINDKFPFDKDVIKRLHPLDYLKLIKNICTFLENQIKVLKNDCKSPFKWQYYKQELMDDWGKWSNKTNKILRVIIKDTEKEKKLNQQYNYVYQYWWQSNFYLEICSLFIHPISQKKSKQLYNNNRKQLEKLIKNIKE